MKLEKVKTDPCFRNRYEDFVLINIVYAEISKKGNAANVNGALVMGMQPSLTNTTKKNSR
jgi:hypothetical protein